jgi:hypothetical protein
MLRIVPLGAFKHGFDLLDESDQPLAAFRGSVWREGGQIVAGPRRCEFRRDGRRRFRLDGPAGTVATAVKPSVWSAGWVVEVGSLRYELVRAGWFARAWQLRGRGQTLGRVAPHRGSTRKAVADLPAELSPPVMAFVVAVVLTLWRRDEAAAAGAAAGGAAASS